MIMSRRTATYFLLAIFLLLQPVVLFASSDVGFEIKRHQFSLTVRLGLAELGQTNISEEREITSADRLFFECLSWVDAHESALKKRKENVIVYWSIQDKAFDIQVNEELIARKTTYTPGSAAITLLRKVEILLGLLNTQSVAPEHVSLFVIRSKAYIDNSYERTDIYFGSIPSYLYSQAEKNYLLLMWSRSTNSKWAHELKRNGETVLRTKLNRQMAKELLGTLE